MAKRYRVTFGQCAFKVVVIALNRAGVRLGPFALLAVAGRTTGSRSPSPWRLFRGALGLAGRSS